MLRGGIKHNIAVSQQSSIALPTICFKGRAATMVMIMSIIIVMTIYIIKIMVINDHDNWDKDDHDDTDNNHSSHFPPSVSMAGLQW